MEIKFTLPIAPSVNQYLGHRVVFIRGKHISQPYETKIAKEYKLFVKNIIHRELKKQEWKTPERHEYVVMDLVFYFDRKRKDSDNAIKVMQDAIVDSCIIEDDDIVMPRVNNIYIDKYNPRVEVSLKLAHKRGIFDNSEHLKKFKELNCNKCKKSTYKRKCGVIQKALENRIEPEIDINKNICYEKKAM